MQGSGDLGLKSFDRWHAWLAGYIAVEVTWREL